jgi:ubiquinone/menaquinone biosynthesis C-methylase UbiE
MSKNQFDELGEGYYDIRGGHVHRYYTDQKVKVLKSYVSSGDSCLDVGCGVGLHSKLLKDEAGCVVHGIDVSQSMVDSANKNLGEGFAIRASAIEIPYRDNSVDVSYTVNVTHHLIRPEAVEKAIAEMARVSRKKVLIFEFNPLNPFCRYLLFKVCPYDNGDERIPSRKEMVEAARMAGLKTNKIRHMSFMPLLCPRFLMGPISRIEPLMEKTIPWMSVGMVYILDKELPDH